MDSLSSSEFRKRYASLETPTLVTVNGHVIGQWTPIGGGNEVLAYPDGSVRVERDPARYGPMTQADRDAVLRKVNRGKG